MTIMLLLLLIWLACGTLNAGWVYAYFQREFPMTAEEYRAIDTRMAIAVSLVFGPAALFTGMMLGLDKHGWLIPGRKP